MDPQEGWFRSLPADNQEALQNLANRVAYMYGPKVFEKLFVTDDAPGGYRTGTESNMFSRGGAKAPFPDINYYRRGPKQKFASLFNPYNRFQFLEMYLPSQRQQNLVKRVLVGLETDGTLDKMTEGDYIGYGWPHAVSNKHIKPEDLLQEFPENFFLALILCTTRRSDVFPRNGINVDAVTTVFTSANFGRVTTVVNKGGVTIKSAGVFNYDIFSQQARDDWIPIPFERELLPFVMQGRFETARKYIRGLTREGGSAWEKDPGKRVKYMVSALPIRVHVLEELRRAKEQQEHPLPSLSVESQRSDTSALTEVPDIPHGRPPRLRQQPRKDYRIDSESEYESDTETGRSVSQSTGRVHSRESVLSTRQFEQDESSDEIDDHRPVNPPVVNRRSRTRSPETDESEENVLVQEGMEEHPEYRVHFAEGPPPRHLQGEDPKDPDGWGGAFGAAAFLLLIAFMVSR